MMAGLNAENQPTSNILTRKEMKKVDQNSKFKKQKKKNSKE